VPVHHAGERREHPDPQRHGQHLPRVDRRETPSTAAARAPVRAPAEDLLGRVRQEQVAGEVPRALPDAGQPLPPVDVARRDPGQLALQVFIRGAGVEGRSVRPDIAGDRVEAGNRQVVADVLAGGGEQIGEHEWERQQTRARIEPERSLAVVAARV
jgi:hypothetical protein